MTTEAAAQKWDPIIVREWDADLFHKRVIDLESEGYVARRDSYRIIADMNPENGVITHVYSIEMYKQSE